MITLTKMHKLPDDYDDEICINPDHIKTMQRVSVGEDDRAVVGTEIDLGIVSQDENGLIVSRPIVVVEDVGAICVMIYHGR